MNDISGRAAPLDPTTKTVDEQNPWLGLSSFTEESRAYFFGREEEVAELARRVQRKLLTVLFGQSGLGKTSILRAGLVPRLRAQGYCPVYVRIDYGTDSPEPSEQIKQAISRSARHAGEWTHAGVAAIGETLWEYLHHRDDLLRDESGNTLIPLVIFDQFEEVFTVAQSDEFGRTRAARFLEELADLVENRPPKSLEARLDEDETAADRFDFSRSDYRVLIALREDYLAPLEGLKKAMPSISQNRLRLAPMTGTQALAAVLQPGKKLVTEEVAAAIVRFVAGGAELANAEVEPALLSLICRELNDARISQGRSEISLDLLAGSHGTILSNFYERSLADQPPAVRQIIEDDLLTSSGYRENVAEERLISRFSAAGAAPNTLFTLVNRRLLRIEERLDVRRVELTHDVLCGVVKASRDLRREREARDATERVLAEQRERELAARRALVRARQIAFGCTVLAIGALIAAVLAVLSTQRAHRAEVEAQQTRAAAEQARSGAEHLLAYLTDDFVRELESFGQLNVVAEFSKRQIDYFHSLPPALKGVETTRNGALAMVHYARAMRALGDLGAADTSATEAVRLLEQQRQAGDDSEPTTIALALGYAVEASILDNRNDPAGPTLGKKAADLLKPFAEAPSASVAVRKAYVQVLQRLGFEQQANNQNEEAVLTEQEAMRLAAALGALDLSNIDMAAFYAEAASWRVTALQNLGRNEEARRLGEDALALSDKLLERRPGYRLALHAQQVIAGGLSGVARNEMDPGDALKYAQRDEQVSITLLNLDPNNTVSANNLGAAHQELGDVLWSLGRLREGVSYYLKSLDDFRRAAGAGTGQVILYGYQMSYAALQQAILGDMEGVAVTLASGKPLLAKLYADEPKGSMAPVIFEGLGKGGEAFGALQRDDLTTARRIAQDVMNQVRPLKPERGVQENEKYITLFWAANIAGHAEFLMGDYPAAEREQRESLQARKKFVTESIGDQRDVAEISIWLAMALARQGKLAEAAAVIAPVVKFQRGLAAKNRGDKWLPYELAGALYVQALAEPPKSAALLREAAALMDGLAGPLKPLHNVRLWRERIQKAQRGAV